VPIRLRPMRPKTKSPGRSRGPGTNRPDLPGARDRDYVGGGPRTLPWPSILLTDSMRAPLLSRCTENELRKRSGVRPRCRVPRPRRAGPIAPSVSRVKSPGNGGLQSSPSAPTRSATGTTPASTAPSANSPPPAPRPPFADTSKPMPPPAPNDNHFTVSRRVAATPTGVAIDLVNSQGEYVENTPEGHHVSRGDSARLRILSWQRAPPYALCASRNRRSWFVVSLLRVPSRHPPLHTPPLRPRLALCPQLDPGRPPSLRPVSHPRHPRDRQASANPSLAGSSAP
jgi:hypothetical protein